MSLRAKLYSENIQNCSLAIVANHSLSFFLVSPQLSPTCCVSRGQNDNQKKVFLSEKEGRRDVAGKKEKQRVGKDEDPSSDFSVMR